MEAARPREIRKSKGRKWLQWLSIIALILAAVVAVRFLIGWIVAEITLDFVVLVFNALAQFFKLFYGH